jgi:hypothetical protein
VKRARAPASNRGPFVRREEAAISASPHGRRSPSFTRASAWCEGSIGPGDIKTMWCSVLANTTGGFERLGRT